MLRCSLPSVVEISGAEMKPTIAINQKRLQNKKKKRSIKI